jgi:uncharacterized protein (UPF0335 family)
MDNVYVQPLKLNGTVLVKHAHAQLTLLEINVNHAQPQEYGMFQQTNVSVLLQQMSGTETNVFAQLADMAQAVFNVQLQEDGIQLLINVSVIVHLSGMVKIVFVHNHISYIKEDVLDVHQDSNGLIIDVKNVTVIIKISKFSPDNNFENDPFIVLFVNKSCKNLNTIQ